MPVSASGRASRSPGSVSRDGRSRPTSGRHRRLGDGGPEGKLTNADLEARDIGTTNQWILERTGISERRMCAPDETTAGLAIAAGNAAIKSAGITPGDLGMVIVATCTPEQPIPETSSFVAEGLGVRCGAFDVGAACAGFSYGLVVATGLVAAGASQPILLDRRREPHPGGQPRRAGHGHPFR